MINLVSQLAIGLLAGWYAADLLSGLYHYAIDHFGSETTPLLGSQIEEAAIHHIRPREFLKYTAWQSCRLQLFFAVPALAVTAIPMEPVGKSFLIALAIGTTLSQQVHKWSHDPRAPSAVKTMQAVGLFISYEGHRAHHVELDRNYCVLCGWANPLMNAVLPRKKVKMVK